MESEYKKCPFCAEEIKADAKICRYCHKEQVEKDSIIDFKDVIIMSIIVLVAFIGYKYITAYHPTAEDQRRELYIPVAEDYIEQYNMAVRQGDKTQIVVQAGIVAAAFLQAHDEVNYQKWKEIQNQAQKAAEKSISDYYK